MPLFALYHGFAKHSVQWNHDMTNFIVLAYIVVVIHFDGQFGNRKVILRILHSFFDCSKFCLPGLLLLLLFLLFLLFLLLPIITWRIQLRCCAEGFIFIRLSRVAAFPLPPSLPPSPSLSVIFWGIPVEINDGLMLLPLPVRIRTTLQEWLRFRFLRIQVLCKERRLPRMDPSRRSHPYLATLDQQ